MGQGTTHAYAAKPCVDCTQARGTTLGADNGVGVCAALALLDADPSVKLPPLECLFTVDEVCGHVSLQPPDIDVQEQGLTGASGLDPSLVTGKIMLNLDTEDWGARTGACIVCCMPRLSP